MADKKQSVMEEIVSSYELYLKELYGLIKSPLKIPKDYTADDVETFSILLTNYQKLPNFKESGSFLSILCNNCKDTEITIHTRGLETLIDELGFHNKDKVITVQGNAGDGVGRSMNNGTITVQGNAGGWVGWEMNNGTINVQGNAGKYVGCDMKGGSLIIGGNAGKYVGCDMKGGSIYLNGDYESLESRGYLGRRTIYHKGRLIVRDGKLRRLLGDLRYKVCESLVDGVKDFKRSFGRPPPFIEP